MGTFSERPQFHTSKFSHQFEQEFVDLFKIKYAKNSWVIANRAYNEMIRDPYHTHLNATRWTSLAEFCSYLEHKNEGKLWKRKREMVADREMDMLMLIDTQAILEKEKLALKLSSKEID